MAIVETISLSLTVGEAFLSSTGKKFVKGEVYALPKDEAMALLGVKGDYDVRFFKKVDGGKTATPVDLETVPVLPEAREVAASMTKASKEAHAAAKALDKADAIASATRGQGDADIEDKLALKARISELGSQSAAMGTGEIDTATEGKHKGKGKPSSSVGAVAV